MRVYSSSLGKVIETSEAPSGAGGAGEVGGLGKTEDLQRMLGLSALGKGQYATAGQFLLPSEAERTTATAKRDADQLITTLENFYFNNKLHYGKNRGILEGVLSWYDPDRPLGQYNKLVASKGVTLARAAGDVGNIAYAEQVAQLKGVAGGRLSRQGAETQFGLLREGFGLPKRDYSGVGVKGIKSLMKKYGG